MSTNMLEVTVLSVAMFLSTTAIGMVPMICTVSEKFLKMTSIYGAGLLVGAAFLIIIPEGLGTLIGSFTKDGHDIDGQSHGGKIDPEALNKNEYVDVHGLGECVGLSMTLGFLLMLLIDECGKSSKNAHNHGLDQVDDIIRSSSEET
jgi:zinc transporter 9